MKNQKQYDTSADDYSHNLGIISEPCKCGSYVRMGQLLNTEV